MVGYDDLNNYYKTNFSLMQHHKYSLSDIENMMPYEKFIYVDMLKAHIQEEKDKAREAETQRQLLAKKSKRR